MKLPYIKSKGRSYSRMDSISGTVTSLDPSFLSAGKLSNSNNLWNAQGILSTRPGFVKTDGGLIINNGSYTDYTSVFYADFPFTYIDNYNSLCALVRETAYDRTDIDILILNNEGQAKTLFNIPLVAPNGGCSYEVINMLFVKDTPIKGSGIYIIIPIKVISQEQEETTQVRYYELNSDYSYVTVADQSYFYRPLIMKHGHGNEYSAFIEPAVKDTVYPEGVNILGGNFEADFSCDGVSYEFVLPVGISENSTVTIEYYTSSTQKRTFTVPINSSYSEEQDYLDVSLKFRADRASGTITALGNNEVYSLPRHRTDNSLRIFAYTDTGSKAYELFSRRAKPVSFDRRLFLSGGETKGDKIYFSGKDHPLYFSQENSFTVGDNSNAVTALSQQNRYVIAFKEREMYRITLQETAVPDRDTLRDTDSIKTVPAPARKIVRITNHIGCDRPLTIKTCGNRLVWYHSDGAVYTLYGSNLYSEGSVYELSAEIKNRLTQLSNEDNEHIFAVDINGYYGLATKDGLFIMDSLISGFTYLSGHKSADKSYSGLAWFFWTAPENTVLIDSFVRAGKPYFILSDKNSKYYYITSLSSDTDLLYSAGGDDLYSEQFFYSYFRG